MNLFHYLLEVADPERIAVIEEGNETSYRELAAFADVIACNLLSSGIKFQNRVGILAENSSFWIASYLGILKIGAIAVPLPSRLTMDDLGNYVRMIDCHAMCADDYLAAKYARIIPDNCILLPKSRLEESWKEGACATATEVEERCPAGNLDERTALAALMFTSGSTGLPNAVKVTHQNIMANTAAIGSYLGLTSADRIMDILPFHYCFGTSLLHTHLRAGGSLVINNYFQYTEDVLNEMEQYSCTGFAGVPSTYHTLLNNRSFRSRQFKSLRYLQQAGGKLSEKYITELRLILPAHVQLFIGYGQTEATARLSYLPPENLEKKTNSIGRGVPGVTLQIIDKEGNTVNPGEIGEIVADGENVTAGYWLADPSKNPFRDGKLYTGDLAYRDEDGFIYIVGREKEFIKPNGYKVMTASIENVMLELSEVSEVAVTGVPDDTLGEVAKAFVVMKPGMDIECEQLCEKIMAFCKTNLPSYAVPGSLIILPSLPKNSSGKVMKHELARESDNSAKCICK